MENNHDMSNKKKVLFENVKKLQLKYILKEFRFWT